jgi:hypothetical protein
VAYSRKFTPVNEEKYVGRVEDIMSRSTWEYAVFKWCDRNPDVIEWNSEEAVIPYICPTDNRRHRYFIDLYIKFSSGRQCLIEIKPEYETKPPKTPKKRTKRFITESLKYAKNQAKWEAASNIAKENGMEFYVWTEHTIRSLGIKII